MLGLETRILNAESSVDGETAEIHRPRRLGLVRRILPVRPAARRMPRASPGPAQPAAARGRLAGLGIRGRTRSRQDAEPALAGSSTASTTAP